MYLPVSSSFRNLPCQGTKKGINMRSLYVDQRTDTYEIFIFDHFDFYCSTLVDYFAGVKKS